MKRETTMTGNRRFRLQSGTTVMVRENRKQLRALDRAIARAEKNQEGFAGDLFGTDFIAQERRTAYEH